MAVDYHLKIDGIEGESEQKGFEKQIQITSWSWGQTNTGTFATGSGGGSGKVNMQDFHFTMPVGKAAPALMVACATGQHIAKAVLTCRKAGQKSGQQPYLIITFSDLLISSYQAGGSHGAESLPVDQISFNYSKVEWEYHTQDNTTGATKKAGNGGYDLKKNTKV